MPGLTGFELQEKCASKGIRTPISAASAFDDAETRERARALGATALFKKQDEGQALIDTIHWALGIAKDHPVDSDS